MKKYIVLGAFLVLLVGLVAGWSSVQQVAAQIAEIFYGDPDMGPFDSGMSKEEFMEKRSEGIAMLRGVEKDKPFDPQKRISALKELDQQEVKRFDMPASISKNILLAAWTEIGPNPIPNGQVVGGSQLPVSGRTVSIAVHPTNPNLVYVGAAQGGLYRSTDGGTTWTPMMDNAASLAIGAIAIAPSQPDTVYIGTGEHNFSLDSFFGVGVYRIDNASTASPTITGPLNKDGSNADIFTGRGISRIIVHPTNPAIIWVASTSGVGGISGSVNNVLPNRGVYRSTNATAASPTFTQVGVLPPPSNNSVRDIAMDPGNPDIMIANPIISGGTGGIYRTTNAQAATPTWTQTFAFTGSTSTSNLTAEFAAIHPAADANATFYAAAGNNSAGTGTGRVLKSTDGGATFTEVNPISFCGGQCFYNIAVAVDPTNVNGVYLGGTGTNTTFAFSTNGGTSFTNSQANLHTDSQVITVAPSLPSTIYFGSDGGIYKSTDSGATWASLNNTTYRATQFMSIATHPTDPNFTIGGTQDNGTEFYRPNGTWTRADFGDGGYSVIDQSSSSTTTVNMFHTYFNNVNNLQGYAYITDGVTPFQNWTFRGCQSSGTTTNGITCNGSILFYAPLEQGPGTPNTIYYGSDRLYRSSDNGLNNTVVSQSPITAGIAISAIGISPQDDNVRIVGLQTGGIFGTTTGSSTLTDLDAGNAVPNNYIARTAVDPTNSNRAYVTLSAFGVTNVWKTSNLSNANPTWTAAATGLPQVPVSAFIIDPINPTTLYAGTDIGVYFSQDSGLNWFPFGTGLPRVAVFDMAITANRQLRIATHGRGMWETQAATNTPLGSNVIVQTPDALVTFPTVTQAGTTTFTPINPGSAGTLPNGYAVCPTCPAYDITTTAAYTPPLMVCLGVPASISQQIFLSLTLLHGEGGVLVDRTTARFTDTNGYRTVCGSVSSLSPFVLAQAPAAAPATVDGRVLTSDARGLRNATVSITDSNNVIRRATTSSFGFFSFDNIATGQTYTVRISSRLFRYSPQTFQVNGNLTLPDFVGLE